MGSSTKTVSPGRVNRWQTKSSACDVPAVRNSDSAVAAWPPVPGQELGERRAKPRIARLFAVVELDWLRMREEALARGTHAPQRQQVRGRLPDAEVDHAGFRRAVESDFRAHAATSAADTSRNTSPGFPCRYAPIFCAEMRRRSARAASE